jgi:hypothetical protein
LSYIPDYRDGTVSLATGTRDLVGVGTAWASGAGIQTGDMFLVGGFVALIETVVDDTHITLRDNWGGPTLPAGSSYSIKFSPDQSRVQASVAALINRLGNGNVDALAALDIEADTLPYGNGPGSLALAAFTDIGRALVGAADTAAAQTAIGGGEAGRAVFVASDKAAAQTAISTAAVGKNVLAAADEAAAQGALGATDVGKALLGAIDQAAGRAAIAAQQQDDQLSAIAALTGLGGAFIRWTGASSAVMQAINGICAESGGSATGSLFEQAANASGQYFRFAGGMQICYTRLDYGGSGAGIRTVNWTYPAAFAYDPMLLGSAEGFGEAFRFIGISGPGKPGPTGATPSIEVTAAGAGTVICQAVAIGRWF